MSFHIQTILSCFEADTDDSKSIWTQWFGTSFFVLGIILVHSPVAEADHHDAYIELDSVELFSQILNTDIESRRQEMLEALLARETQGDRWALWAMATLYAHRVIEADSETELAFVSKAIDASLAELMVRQGIQLTEDGYPTEGVRLINAGAKQGFPYALYIMSKLYRSGNHGITLDKEHADQLLRTAAGLRQPQATAAYLSQLAQTEPQLARRLTDEFVLSSNWQIALALAQYQYDLGLAGDATQAFDLFSTAADLGSEEAGIYLVQCYRHGYGIAASPEEADKLWFEVQANLTATLANQAAWKFATHPKQEVRDPQFSITLLEPFLQKAENRTGARLDTLAAAYAALGDFESAKTLQREALNLLDEPTLRQRLSMYERAEPYYAEELVW